MLSLKTNESLMRVWNGKITAENVLVEGGGIESVSVDWLLSEGAPTTISAITAVLSDSASTLVTEL